MKKRFLSLFLIIVLLASMAPGTALAQGAEGESTPTVTGAPFVEETQAAGQPEQSETPVEPEQPEDPVIPESEAPVESEPPVESQTSAEPAQDAPPQEELPTESAVIAAAESKLTGDVTLSFSQEKTSGGEVTNVLAIYLVSSTWTDDYTVKLKEPGGTTEEDITKALQVVSSQTRTYTLSEPQAGEYIVKITDTKTGVCIEGKMKIYKVTFHTGNDGRFTDGTTKATGYGYARSLMSQFNKPEVTVTKDGYVFYGWSKTENGENRKTINWIYGDSELESQTEIDLYAVYGIPKTYTFTLTVDDKELKEMETYTFKDKDLGYSDQQAVNFVITNTGNQPLTFVKTSTPANFEVLNFTSTGFKVEPSKTATFQVRPQTGLPAGVYTNILQIRWGSTISNYKLSFTVHSRNIVVTPPERIEKPYGVAWTQDDIAKNGGSIEAKIDSADGNKVIYEELGLTLDSDGFAANAEVKEEGYSYTLSNPNSKNFTATLASDKEYKVYVTPVDPVGSPTAGQVTVGNALSTASLEGEFHHPDHPDWTVSGTLEWENGDEILDHTGTIQKAWKFTPSGKDSNNYKEITGTVDVVVTDLETTTLTAPTETSFEYDGQGHPLTFTCSREGAVTVQYRSYGSQDEGAWSNDAPSKAGTYEVKAKVEASGTYAEAVAETTLTITKRTVTISVRAESREYDGTTTVPGASVTVGNTIAGDNLSTRFTASLDSPNANSYQTVTFHITELTGTNVENYQLPATTTYHTSVTIGKKSVTVKGDASKEYGQDLTLAADQFTVTGLADGDSAVDLGAVFTCEGLSATADAGTYPITVAVNSENYQIRYSSSTSRDNQVGTLTVNKVTPVLRGSVTAGLGKKGGKLSDVALAGEFVNPHDHNLVVTGTFKWTKSGTILPETGTYDAGWTFDMDAGFDKNYNAPEGGTVIITLQDRQPIPMQATDQAVSYDGKSKAFTSYSVGEPGASVSVLYKKHLDLVGGIALFSVGNEYADEKPVDAGDYDVLLSVTPSSGSEYGPNTMETLFTITPAAPTAQSPQNITVPEGTVLSDPAVAKQLAAPTGVDGKPLEGSFTWSTPDAVITEDGETFQWTFTPNDPNYTSVSGTATVTLAPDGRTIKASVYNLPNNQSYMDYAVVDISGSGLKAGNEVTFFADPACTNPESQPTLVTSEKGKLTVFLDADALDALGGKIYARITSSKKNAATALNYGSEPQLNLAENGVPCTDGEIALPADGGSCVVSVSLAGEGYTFKEVTYSLSHVSGDSIEVHSTGDTTAVLTAVTPKHEAVLTALVILTHPDPDKAGETITFTLTARVICKGVVKGQVAPDPQLSPSTPGSNSLVEAVMDPEQVKKAEEAGAVVDVVLSVKAVEESDEAISKDVPVAEAEYESRQYTLGQYMEIDLCAHVLKSGSDEEETTEISQTQKPLCITVHVPNGLYTDLGAERSNMEFAVVRVHEGEADILPDQDENPATVTFETDRFSTYALVYRENMKRGNLTVSNAVSGNKADKDLPFQYWLSVTLDGETLNGTYGDVEFTDGKAGFTLKGGENVTVLDLPAGSEYTVGQDSNPDYATTKSGDTGTIQDGAEANATFTNKRDIWKVTYDGNGGKMAGQGLVTVMTGPNGSVGGTLPTPKKDGVYFAGWYTSRRGGTKVTGQTVFTRDTIIYAHWSKVPLTGDTNNPALWAALLGISALAVCAGAAFFLVRRKKKK